jgi:hypothetical protein
MSSLCTYYRSQAVLVYLGVAKDEVYLPPDQLIIREIYDHFQTRPVA